MPGVDSARREIFAELRIGLKSQAEPEADSGSRGALAGLRSALRSQAES